MSVSGTLGIQHEMRMCRTVICGLPGYTIFYCTLFNKQHDFWKKELLNIECMFWFYLQICLRRMGREIIINIYLSKYQLFMSELSETGIFSTRFSENAQISNFMKTSSVRAQLFHADGRTHGQTGKKIEGQTWQS